MINVADGCAIVKVGGRSFELTPSFFNINKIGTPEEIVTTYQSVLSFYKWPITAFVDALNVLACCGMDDIKVTGSIKYSELSGKTKIVQGEIPYEDILILAQHCLMHGITGDSKQVKKIPKGNPSSTPLKSFNAYVYVLSCVETLNMSFNEAWGLTMTQYVNITTAKVDSMRSRGELDDTNDPEIERLAYERHLEIVKKRNKKRAEKAAAEKLAAKNKADEDAVKQFK